MVRICRLRDRGGRGARGSGIGCGDLVGGIGGTLRGRLGGRTWRLLVLVWERVRDVEVVERVGGG